MTRPSTQRIRKTVDATSVENTTDRALPLMDLRGWDQAPGKAAILGKRLKRP
jgi:hypothetical protein